MIRRTLSFADREPLVDAAMDRAEDENALLFMPPPLPLSEPVPPSPHEGIEASVFQGPIWYRGRQFIWFYPASIGRWQLALQSSPADEAQQAA